MIGQVVNYRYELLEKAGDGNFYSVYKARDKVLNRLVAVKVLNPPASEHPDFAERALAEAQSVQELVHPNIVRVYESDSHDGTYFVAVEYVRGINLKDRIRRTAPFTISYAVDIAIAVADALDYAHKRGVVHGDVRPHNILTSSEGHVKLSDFGTESAVSAFPNLKDYSMLRSIHYSAPEVLKGTLPQEASDIYSLGVVIHEMITGSVPFDGDSVMSIAAKHFQESAPSPGKVNPAVPKMLNDIVLKAMAKEPADRYASAAAMLADLQVLREALRVGKTPSSESPPVTKKEPEAPPPLVLEEHHGIEDSGLRSTVLLLLGVFFVVMAIGVASAYFLIGKRPTQLTVPDFTGMTFMQAQSMAQDRAIELQEYRTEFNDNYPEGQVYLTAPPAGGNVPKESPVVKVWVSKGPRYVVVPSVIGVQQEVALERLGERRLVPRIRQDYSNSIEAGYVISQDPEAGTRLEPPKQVTIVVSQGPSSTSPVSEVQRAPTVGEPMTPDPAEERLIDVTVEVPSEGSEMHVVKILVTDTQGRNQVAYEQDHYSGETFTQTVRAYGDVVKIQVAFDGKVKWSQTFTREEP